MSNEKLYSGSGKKTIWQSCYGAAKHQIIYGSTRTGMSFIHNNQSDVMTPISKLSKAIDCLQLNQTKVEVF
jgi:hypothetical protein